MHSLREFLEFLSGESKTEMLTVPVHQDSWLSMINRLAQI